MIEVISTTRAVSPGTFTARDDSEPPPLARPAIARHRMLVFSASRRQRCADEPLTSLPLMMIRRRPLTLTAISRAAAERRGNGDGREPVTDRTDYYFGITRTGRSFD